MNKTYLISYDLIGGESGFAYQRLRKAITGVSYWAKPLRSVFIIKSNSTAYSIAQALQKSVDSNDKILVIEIGKDWAGLNISTEVINWLKNNL